MRNARNWLTPEALRSGQREQFAVERWPHRHVVSLAFVGEGYHLAWGVTRLILTRAGELVEQHEWHFELLNDARNRWRTEVRKARA